VEQIKNSGLGNWKRNKTMSTAWDYYYDVINRSNQSVEEKPAVINTRSNTRTVLGSVTPNKVDLKKLKGKTRGRKVLWSR